MRDGPASRKAVNGPLLTEILRRWRPARAFVEHIGRPARRRAYRGVCVRAQPGREGVCAGLDIPVSFVTPATWKRHAGIPPGEGKDLARSRAIALWPDKAGLFARVKDHGRAEACLIALAGLSREARR